MSLQYAKIGDKYYTTGGEGGFQSISESDIVGRIGDLPSGTNALDYVRKQGSLIDVDSSKLSLGKGTGADGTMNPELLYNGGQLGSATLQGKVGEVNLQNYLGNAPVNEDFSKYLKDTGQTYNQQQGFSGNASQGITGTQATQQGVKQGTIDPNTGQPINTSPQAGLSRVGTGSVGPDGKPIYDVFSGGEHIQDPNDPRLKGIDIAGLPEGQAPTNFKSKFESGFQDAVAAGASGTQGSAVVQQYAPSKQVNANVDNFFATN